MGQALNFCESGINDKKQKPIQDMQKVYWNGVGEFHGNQM